MNDYLLNSAELKQHHQGHKSRGGRSGSSALRHSIEQCEDFTGLEDNVNRYDLLLLVKRIGKKSGFTPRMISLLDYYMSFTRDIDWEQGSSPIIYQSLSKTALDNGVTERQIQKLAKALFEAGALTWHDSGNHRRYGRRDDKTGRILYAYGVDLTPLAYMKEQLEEKLQEKRMYDEAWMETKRQISFYRGQIRTMMSEMEISMEEEGTDYSTELSDLQKQYDPISIQIRTSLKLESTRELLAKHKELYETARFTLGSCTDSKSLKESHKTNKGSSRSEPEFIHYNSTIKKQSNKLDTNRANAQSFQKSSNNKILGQEIERYRLEDHPENEEEALILKTGLQHITLKQALNASSEKFRDHMPMEERPMNWNDFVEAAYRMKGELMISQSSWAKACGLLGRSGAAICLLLTDQAQQRDIKPVEKTGAYFNAMINRAKEGELHLHKSIFGILQKEFGDMEAV